MPILEIVDTPGFLQRRVFTLREGEYLVGRDAACDVEIADPKVSARHLKVVVRAGRVEIADQNSTNGLFLGEARVSRAIWAPDRPVHIGDTELRLLPDMPTRHDGAETAGAAPRIAGPAAAEAENHASLPGAALRAHGSVSKLALNNSLFDFNIVKERKVRPLDAEMPDPGDRLPRVQDLLERMRVINKAVRSISAALAIPELLDRVLGTLFEVLRCDTGYILLIDPDDQETVSAHLAFENGVRKENLEEKLYSRTLVSKVVRNKSGFIFNSSEGQDTDPSKSIIDLHIDSALVCPIHSEGRVFGAVYLANKSRSSRFTEDDLDLTMNVAGIAGIAVENSQLSRKLRAEALIRDNLRRFLSPNIADRIIMEKGSADFHLGSRKRNITVLFADIRGFTPLSEALAPLDVARMLNLYFSEMCGIVFAHGGTLDKFIGDCMMVLFNAPFSVHNPEFTAVKTARDMRRRLREVLPEWTSQGIPPFQVGIGINSGEAVVGSLGTDARMEYTAIGDCVNIASRVCGLAEPGQLLVTGSVYGAVKDVVAMRPLGATRLKGRSQSVELYEVPDPEGL